MKANSALFLLCILTSVSIVSVLVLKLLLPWSYYALSVLFGVFIVAMLFKMGSKPWMTYVAIIILALVLQNLYNFSTGFSILPLFDSYNDYASINIFMQHGHLYELPMDAAAVNTVHSFDWPLGALLTMTLCQVTGLSIVHSSLLLTSVYGLVMLLAIMLFLRLFFKNSPHLTLAVAVGLLIYAVTPDSIYQRMVFYHRFISLTLFFIALYLLAKDYHEGQFSRRILLLVLTLAIIVSHAYVSYVWILFLIIFMSVSFLSQKVPKMPSNIPKVSYLLPFFAFAIGWLWNSDVIAGPFATLRNYLIRLFTLSSKEFFVELIQPRYVAPEVLTDHPFNYLLNLRDVAFFLPVLLGVAVFLIYLWKKKASDKTTTLILIMGFTFLVLTIIDYFGAPRRSMPEIITSFALPFMVFFAAQLYLVLVSNQRKGARKILKILSYATLIFMVSLAFLAPWSHQYYARYVYDPSISLNDVSMNNPASLQLTPFVNEKFQIQNGDYVLSDNRLILLMILPPDDYSSIRFHGTYPELIGANNTYIFELMNLNPPFDLPEYTWPKQLVESQYNQVYDSNLSVIYYKGH